LIAIHDLSKRYGTRDALTDVTFTVRAGEVTLLLGANGAGKSTLLRCVLGLTTFAGRVRVGGHDPLSDGRTVRSLIGYMPQSGGLHPDLTVLETMRFYAGIRRVSDERAMHVLRDADLAGEASTRVGDLSGGMRQRLGFALALLTDPPILVLDEPSASLDVTSRRWLAGRLRAAARDGRTVLVSTHASQELFDACDRRVVLEDGRVVTDEGSRAAPDAAPESSVPARRANQGAIAPIVRKELRDALRNRWLIGYAALLGVLGLAATATGLDSASGLSLQAFGRTTATLVNLCLLLAPLVALLMGAATIAGEQERGTLEHLLAQPLSRTGLLLAKHAGLLLALTASTFAGFLPAGVLVAIAAGPGMLGPYLLFPALAALTAAATAGMGLYISVISRSAAQAQGTAVFIWFSLSLLYDLVLIGSLSLSGMPVEWLTATLFLNPIDAARVLAVLALEPDLYMLGPAGAFLSAQFAPAGAAALLAGALVFWTGAPLVAAVVTFAGSLGRKRRHETHRIRAASGRERPRRRNRVHVGRGVA
jgi:ABC-type multidrug transport system ATPase subunit/ABC-type transport system involved in multi-copper enzyme maturation permease subunit